MNSQSSRARTNGNSPSRRLDRVSVLLALVTLVLVAWTAWLRFGPASRPEPPAVGQALPPLRLLDVETAEPLVLLGAKGKVSWIVFWSAGSPSGRAGLSQLEGVWKRLKAHRRLTMVTAAVNSDQPERVRAALAEIHAAVPAYLAGPETLRRFGAELADPPLHLLVDGEGQIAALVRGAGQDTFNRLETQVQRWLEEMDPLGNTRFARTNPAGLAPACCKVGPDRPLIPTAFVANLFRSARVSRPRRSVDRGTGKRRHH
ncbi:MAG: hypothetical protein ABSH35_18085 [Isosphaeraceae bacterium]